MKRKIFSTTVTDAETDWFTTTSLDEDNIKKQAKNLLNRPVLVDDTTNERLYSEEQMIEMFRAGFETVSETVVGKKIVTQLKRKTTPYCIIKNMNVGERQVFSFEEWGAVRSAASAMKSLYGAIFKVSKLARSGDIGDIEIIRTY